VNVAIRQGRSGAVSVEDHLPELLLQRSPRLTARLRDRVYGRLASRDPELARTLDVLIEHDFDRGATAAALPVHRNTLSNRINRIRAVTGLDVDEAYGHGLVWLAWLDRNGAA
jgi:PucR family transcriptional regulator, purine catabolism regulatory protein